MQMASKHMKCCLTSLVIREMEIKTTERYYLTPTGLAIIRKSDNNKCLQGVEKSKPYVPLWSPLFQNRILQK